METTTGPKTPLQIRLDQAELAALDAYIAQFTDFPPSRVDVVHKALTEWLAQKREPPSTHRPHKLPVWSRRLTRHTTSPSSQPGNPSWPFSSSGSTPRGQMRLWRRWDGKPESVAAHLRFMAAAGVVGYREVGQGKEKRKAYFLTVLLARERGAAGTFLWRGMAGRPAARYTECDHLVNLSTLKESHALCPAVARFAIIPTVTRLTRRW